MTAHHTLADRLRARARQLDIPPAHLAEKAGVNRSFVYDILRGRSAHPSREKLATLADLLKVDLDWLLHGIGEVEGVSPFIENPDETFVAIAHASPRPSMGGGAVVAGSWRHPAGRAYHFRRSWIRQGLEGQPIAAAHPACRGRQHGIPRCRTATRSSWIISRRSPVPPGIFVLR
jgi:transcriptional regulator with XRE-family HTH domain